MATIPSTDPSDIANAARCFSCNVTGINELALRTYLLTQTADRSTPPCVTPTTPNAPTVFQALDNILKISWTQPANTGSLIMSYTVSYGTTSGGPYTNTITVHVKQAVLNGLSAGTTYYFIVTSNSFAGCSSAASAQGSGTTTGSPPISPVVTDWSNRVVANGGAQPSNATILAVDAFYKGLQADGIDGLMIAVNVCAPDNLIAAITPLIKVAGNDPWTNHNFVAACVSTAGLRATGGANMYLQTGVIPNTAVASDNDIGYTIYGEAGGTTAQNTMIAQDGGGHLAGIWSQTFCAMYNGWDFTVVTPGGPGIYALVSCSRTAANAEAAYTFNSISGFAVFGTSAAAPNPRPTVELYMGCWNQSGVAVQFNGASQWYSFVALHHGLTQAQTQALCNRVQTLRTAFGGGFS